MAISVVHSTSAKSTSVTIPSTTAGNCLVVLVSSHSTSGAVGSISGITLGGAADHFGDIKDKHAVNGSTACDAFVWADPNCAGGQTAVAISGTLSINAVQGGVTVLEVAGLALTLGALLDKFNTGSSTLASSWTSNATPTTTQPAELWAGCMAGTSGVSAPGAPWTNAAGINSDSAQGWQVTSSTGAATYSGTQTAGVYAAVVVTLLPPAAGGVNSGAFLAMFP